MATQHAPVESRYSSPAGATTALSSAALLQERKGGMPLSMKCRLDFPSLSGLVHWLRATSDSVAYLAPNDPTRCRRPYSLWRTSAPGASPRG